MEAPSRRPTRRRPPRRGLWAALLLAAGQAKSAAAAVSGAACGQTATAVPAAAAAEAESCLAAPPRAVLEQVRRLHAHARREGDLPVSAEASFMLLALTLEQCRLGISGAVGEIGTSRALRAPDAGISFHALSLARRAGESLFLNGPFVGELGDARELELEPSFDERDAVLIGQPGRVTRFAAPQAAVTEAVLLQSSGGVGFRLLRLDRVRGANETLGLLRTMSCALAEGGVLMLEDTLTDDTDNTTNNHIYD